MQIRSVLAGHPDWTALGGGGDVGEAAGRRPAESAPPHGPALKKSAAAEIISRYDVHSISPLEFSEMVQKLYEAGAISQTELQQLAAIRHDLDAEGLKPEESVDLLGFYVQQIESLQRRMDPSDGPPKNHEQLGPMLRRLDWVEKLALIQATPDAIGLDEVA